jgi:hypothetical protein
VIRPPLHHSIGGMTMLGGTVIVPQALATSAEVSQN